MEEGSGSGHRLLAVPPSSLARSSGGPYAAAYTDSLWLTKAV